MPEQSKYRYADVCAQLEREAANCSFRIKQTEDNTGKVAKIKDNLAKYDESILKLQFLVSELKPMIADIVEYITERRSHSSLAIKQALLVAGNIVPASAQGIKFTMENGEAWFETSDGLSLDRVEGSGYRATLSLFMRAVFLRSNPQFLQTMILDELLAKLSPERSAVLSTYLPVLGESMQIICIEQKPEVFADAVCISFLFTLVDGVTVVRKE